MEGGNTNNSRFIRYFMKVMTNKLDTRKELFDLINFDGEKMVQVESDLLEV